MDDVWSLNNEGIGHRKKRVSDPFSNDTIAAQATAPGSGGVGIIRVSGPQTLVIARKILHKGSGRTAGLTPQLKPKEATFCSFINQEGKIIDQGVAIYFAAPNSFTGEDVLELHGHGGQVIMDVLLEQVLKIGARLANPGEFTQRAFLNGKLDLVQAEAVSDLITASTSQAAQNAIRSLQGEFSREINRIIDVLTDLRVTIEATIDFVEEEDVKEIEIKKVKQGIENVSNLLNELKTKAKQGVVLQEGINIVITGKPNAGKSSLLNCLSKKDVAIVAATPGTTRDILRSWIQIDNVAVHVLDTAGLHDNPDPIEAEGIRRAWDEIEKADHLLLVVDASLSDKDSFEKQGQELLQRIPAHSKLTVLYNKIDLFGGKGKVVDEGRVTRVYISTKTGAGLDLLQEHLKNGIGEINFEGGFSAKRRHLDALRRAQDEVEKARIKCDDVYLEELAEDLRYAQNILGEITGKVVVDDLLDKIFSEFCVGK